MWTAATSNFVSETWVRCSTKNSGTPEIKQIVQHNVASRRSPQRRSPDHHIPYLPCLRPSHRPPHLDQTAQRSPHLGQTATCPHNLGQAVTQTTSSGSDCHKDHITCVRPPQRPYNLVRPPQRLHHLGQTATKTTLPGSDRHKTTSPESDRQKDHLTRLGQSATKTTSSGSD